MARRGVDKVPGSHSYGRRAARRLRSWCS
jgi:hypothetical protein